MIFQKNKKVWKNIFSEKSYGPISSIRKKSFSEKFKKSRNPKFFENLENEKSENLTKSKIFEKSEIHISSHNFAYQNLSVSTLNRPIKCKETKYRVVQARLKSKINLHPPLAKQKIQELGQCQFK